MTATEEEKKPKYVVPTVEGLRRSMWKLMPLIDERIKEGRLD